MKLIAIFPARHNSNRLPDKNFKDFFGIPMLAWSLHESIQSELFDKIIVSTDKRIEWINEIQNKGGLTNVGVHTRRGKAMQYDCTVDDICLDVLDKYKDYDYVCVIYPTAYAVTWKDLCKSFKEIREDSLKHSSNAIGVGNDIDNGGFYWQKVDQFIKHNDLMKFSERFELPMVDINTIQDFAEAKLHALELSCERFK